MSEPAFKYDDEEEPQASPNTRRRFGVIQGGGEGDGVPQGSLSAVPDDTSDTREVLNANEQNPTSKPDSSYENPFGYSKDENTQDKPQKGRVRAWLSRNKLAVAGGGGAGVVVGLFTMLGAFKIQGVTDLLSGTAFGRIESNIEKRASKMILTGILRNKELVDARNLVKGGSLMERVAKTIATSKYEDRLAAKGITFVPNSVDGKVTSVSIELVGDDLTEAKKLLVGKTFKTVDEVDAALGNITATRSIMRDLIKNDMGFWGYFARGKLVRWMGQYLGVKRFGTKETDKNATPEDKVKAQAASDIADSLEAEGAALDNGLNVMENAEKSGSDPEKTTVSTEGADASKQSLKEAVSQTSKETADDLAKATSTEAVSKVSQAVTEKLTKVVGAELAGKIGTKAIPYYGEAVLVAQAINFSHWAVKNTVNGRAARAIALPAAVLAGFVFAKWQGIGSQAKLGSLDTDLFNYYAPFLDNVASSSLFNCVTTSWQSGCDSQGLAPAMKLNETNSKVVQDIADAAKGSMGLVIGDQSPVYLLARIIYQFDDKVVGGVLSFFIDQYISALTASLNAAKWLATLAIGQSQMQAIQDSVSTLLGKMGQYTLNYILKLFGLDINSNAEGNKLFDFMLNGGVYSANRFAETSLGAHTISLQTASAQTQQYLADERDDAKSKGLLYALFSPDYSGSITSRIAAQTNTSGGMVNTASNTVGSLLALVKDTPSSIASVASGTASAATYSSPEAVLNAAAFGFTDADLAAPINKTVTDGGQCNTSTVSSSIASFFGVDDPNAQPYDNCKLDTAVAQNIICSLDPVEGETAACNPDVNTGADTSSANAAGNTSVEANGAAWVLGANNWTAYRSDFLKAHYTSGNYGGGIPASDDISWSGIEGTPIYAIYGGTVVQQPLGRSSHICTGNPNANNNGGLEISSSINGHTVTIYYAHAKNVTVTVGSTVATGQHVADVGDVGNSCAPHLHMDILYDGKSICPQDLFLAMGSGSPLDLAALAAKATAGCSGRL